jgi:hypothetical protein
MQIITSPFVPRSETDIRTRDKNARHLLEVVLCLAAKEVDREAATLEDGAATHGTKWSIFGVDTTFGSARQLEYSQILL